MISWINGELVELWQINQKFFVLINCQGLGYEIQILESFFLKLKSNQIMHRLSKLKIYIVSLVLALLQKHFVVLSQKLMLSPSKNLKKEKTCLRI